LKEIFTSRDKENTKKLSYDELVIGYQHVFGSKRPTKDVVEIINRIKDEGEGLLNYENFCLLYFEKKQNIYIKNLENALLLFNKDGLVYCSEIIEILSNFGVDDNFTVNRLIDEVDSFKNAVYEKVFSFKLDNTGRIQDNYL
jgi:Ca2+-binding EF-hand superfamily protein